MLDAALGGVSRIPEAVADGACTAGRGMADIPCGVTGLLGGVFSALLDALLRSGLVGVSEGAGEGQCQRGKQEQVAFHDGNPLKRVHIIEASMRRKGWGS